MKLILILLVTNLGICISQRYSQEYTFPPQYQTPSTGVFASDSSIYLPPEPQTPLPYFTVTNTNKLPFQFLPPSGTKAPSVYPTPYPEKFPSRKSIIEEADNKVMENTRMASPRPTVMQNTNQIKNHNNNISDSNQEKRESRSYPNKLNFQQQSHFVDKVDERYRFQKPQPSISPQLQSPQNSASRRMILTSEIQRNEESDQVKAASYSTPHYIPVNIYGSSTTEPAIPILRLSNEMDLDGSFSYEALGADQTHYVQNSHMENMGTDKEEQVVEGSYSYVGDNGQTYTVHYVADSNGYRASGDHLPVAPPIPEIIQRAIQYNLAEESRKPPHQRNSWENTGSGNENYNDALRYTNPPTRSLFTGKTPEAFSFGLSQNFDSQQNLATAASSYAPTKTNFDIAVELSKAKAKSVPITPQVTFTASQGAHNPSVNPQQSVPRTTSSEKTSLPQIINYEADARETEQENNKALWRWQYGLNTNNAQQTPVKTSISRSFGEGDDIIINFNDMTPDQYTNMIKNEVIRQTNDVPINDNNKYQSHYSQPIAISQVNEESSTLKSYINKNHFHGNDFKIQASKNIIPTTTEMSDKQIQIQTEHFDSQTEENLLRSKELSLNSYSGLIRQENFMPPSKLVTQSYDYEEITYEPKRTSVTHESFSQRNNINPFTQKGSVPSPSSYWSSNGESVKSTTSLPQDAFEDGAMLMTYSQEEHNNINSNLYRAKEQIKETTHSENSIEELIKDNIFLINAIKPKNERNVQSLKTEKTNIEQKTNPQRNVNSESKVEKKSKYAQLYPKPNEIASIKKPLDIHDVLNYVVMKENFELSKTKPKNKPNHPPNADQQKDNKPTNFIPVEEDRRQDIPVRTQDNIAYKTLNQEHDELRGIIKNYKVLHRQRSPEYISNQNIPDHPRHLKIFHSPSLPPLGRAGPTMKSYLPPAYL